MISPQRASEGSGTVGFMPWEYSMRVWDGVMVGVIRVVGSRPAVGETEVGVSPALQGG